VITAVRENTSKLKNVFKLQLKYPQGDPTKFTEKIRGIDKTNQQG
jgi:hypothetical protein